MRDRIAENQKQDVLVGRPGGGNASQLHSVKEGRRWRQQHLMRSGNAKYAMAALVVIGGPSGHARGVFGFVVTELEARRSVSRVCRR